MSAHCIIYINFSHFFLPENPKEKEADTLSAKNVNELISDSEGLLFKSSRRYPIHSFVGMCTLAPSEAEKEEVARWDAGHIRLLCNDRSMKICALTSYPLGVSMTLWSDSCLYFFWKRVGKQNVLDQGWLTFWEVNTKNGFFFHNFSPVQLTFFKMFLFFGNPKIYMCCLDSLPLV